MSKIEIRKKFFTERSSLIEEKRQQAAESAAFIFLNSIFSQARCVACYLPINKEFETKFIIEKIWQAGNRCYLPVIQSIANKQMQFVLYDKNSILENNSYRILEPKNKKNLIAVEELDLVIMPLVSFDNNGHRIGMGGGFYDKTFAFTQNKHLVNPKLLGLGYDFQEYSQLPSDPWDIRLNAILTESRLNIFS